MPDPQKYIAIEIGGSKEHIWKRFRKKLVDNIDKLLDFEIDSEKGSTLREEAKKFTSALLNYGKSKLSAPGINNEKTLAEIEELYSKREKSLAEARKIHAEADLLEFSLRIQKLKTALKLAKVVLPRGKRHAVFLKDIDLFLDVVRSIEEEKGIPSDDQELI